MWRAVSPSEFWWSIRALLCGGGAVKGSRVRQADGMARWG